MSVINHPQVITIFMVNQCKPHPNSAQIVPNLWSHARRLAGAWRCGAAACSSSAWSGEPLESGDTAALHGGEVMRCVRMGSMINPNCGKNIMGRNDDGPQLWMDGVDGVDGLWVIYFWTKLVWVFLNGPQTSSTPQRALWVKKPGDTPLFRITHVMGWEFMPWKLKSRLFNWEVGNPPKSHD